MDGRRQRNCYLRAMDEIFDQTYDRVDFTGKPLKKGSYDNCVFANCQFGGSNLSESSFIDCRFIGCNLSMASMGGTVFRDVLFKECKLSGIRFDECNEFGLDFSFEHCLLDFSSFYQRKLKKIKFLQCQLKEVDFSDADLSQAVLDKCDLNGAKFENTLLEKTDLRTAFNYAIDPEKNRIKKARFSLPEVIGLLAKYDIDISRG